MKRHTAARWAAALLASPLLAACGGLDEDIICQPVVGSGAVISRAPGTEVEDDGRAYDQSLSSSAEMFTLSGEGSATFRVSSRQPGGRVVGVLLGMPAGQVTTVDIRATSEGEVVRSGRAGTQSDSSQVCAGTCVQSNGLTFFGLRVDSAFDALEATIGVTGTTASTRVHELCARS